MMQETSHAIVSRTERMCLTDEDFLDLASGLADGRAAVLLASGSQHELSVRSIAVLQPVLLFTAKGRRCRLVTADTVHEADADPFDILDELAALLPTDDRAWLDSPMLAGYVAYEAGRVIEQLPQRSNDTLGLPDLLFILPALTVVHDRAKGIAVITEFLWRKGDGNILQSLPPIGQDSEGAATASGAQWTRGEYLRAAERVRKHIHEGDVYQVNLAQRFTFPLHEAAMTLWRRLFAANPSPFAAWIDAAEHQVLCTSMERLFCIDGNRIETRPIKGTRPRGTTTGEDEELGSELLSHPKDDAELSMIVDLERNDLGRICTTGSVVVREHKRLERYANVMHLVSVVEGVLNEGTSIAGVFRALFPGGSITGCPKIRAMEIIDELEPTTRHTYTGAIGYIANRSRCDFNIAIRTAIVKHGVCTLSLGGGIVYDSNPMDEYRETLDKGRTFFSLLGVDEAQFTDTV